MVALGDRFQVGEWVVHPQLNQIEKGEESRRLEPKVMNVLSHLAAHAGEVMTRERLLQAIWPDTFVGDEVLTYSISELRRTLGDDAHSPLYIETIPRRGYRLIASVSFPEDGKESTLDHYRVIRKLGEGGMGEVHLAEHTVLHRRVALKFLRPEKESEATGQRRLRREARAAAALDHPYICKIYEIGLLEGHIAIAMEYIEGEKLSERLKRGRLPLEEALRIGVEIAEALEVAHRHGIVHRDIKPSNVILTEQGHVKITDFGIAKRFERDPSDPEDWTLAGTTQEISGTPDHMSPEQIRGEAVDQRTDVFLFGIVLYEMVTGTHPFRTETQADTTAAILNDDPRPVSRKAGGAWPELARIIGKALEKDRGLRYPSASRLVADLRRLQSSESGRETDGLQYRVRKMLWLAPAALTMAFLAAAGWWLLPSKPDSEPVLTAIPFTTYHGYEGRPTFSPDGSQVAFQWNGEKEDNEDIYVKSVGSEKPLRLTSDPATEGAPSWSPDGSYIAFLRVGSNRVEVLTIPPVGGIERKVYETRYVWKAELTGRKLRCTPDSRGFVVSERDSPSDPNALFMVIINTGEKRRLTSPPAGFEGDSDPVFSPDGRTLTFSRKRAVDSDDLFRIDLSADFRPLGEPKPLTNRMPVRYRNFVGHAWRANGREIIASLAHAANRFDLWRVPLNDPQYSTRLEFVGEGGTYPVVSGSARRIVYEKGFSTVSTWSLEDRGDSIKSAVPTRLLGSTQWDNQCQVSPDGDKIAFRSARSGFSEVCTSNSDGSGFLWLTRYEGPTCGSPAWSPDSRWIAYDARPESQSEIYVVSAAGGPARRITNHPGEDIMPSWSRNGRWIYFTSNRTGPWQVWKMPVGGGIAVQVTQKGGFYGVESIDGKTLFYGKRLFELGVYRMPFEGGEEGMFLPDAWITRFAPTVKGYYFWTSDRALTFLDSSTATRRILTVLDKPPADFLSVFPDGKRIVYSQVDQSSSDLYLVEDFR